MKKSKIINLLLLTVAFSAVAKADSKRPKDSTKIMPEAPYDNHYYDYHEHDRYGHDTTAYRNEGYRLDIHFNYDRYYRNHLCPPRENLARVSETHTLPRVVKGFHTHMHSSSVRGGFGVSGHAASAAA